MNSTPTGMFARSPWWVPWLFLAAGFVIYAIVQMSTVGSVAERNQEARVAIQAAEVRGCERVNILREVQREHLTTDATDRLADGQDNVARAYLELAGRIPEVDCEAEFPSDEINRAGLTP